jgi:ABC-type uncharacterized transport system ATPase subunit
MHLEMRGITKRFGPVLANDHIALEVLPGEIHSVLGENGAGKTTLMNILYGMYQADEGDILIDNRKVEIRSPRDSINLRIGMVHQHFLLVAPFTVAENVILGLPASFGSALNMREARRRIRQLSDEYGLTVDPDARIWQLSVGVQQRVEILKACYRGADVLILDEPTSVLTPQETEELFGLMRAMRDRGSSIIFITHKLPEVMEISDRVTVLRDGRVVGTMDVCDTSPKQLGRMMIGREVFLEFGVDPAKPGEAVLRLDQIQVRDERGLPAVRGVSLTVNEGELVGIAGVDGNGQQEIAEAIMGLRPVESGDVIISGTKTTKASTREILDRCVAYIPADRMKAGVVPAFTIAENCILGYQDESPFARRILRKRNRGWFLDLHAIDAHAGSLVKQFNIRTAGLNSQTSTLSGGNLQKLVLARSLACDPKLLIALNPTRGLDVGATEFVRRQLLHQRDAGCAVLLISVDLDEIRSLCDRIAVIHRGRIMGIVPGGSPDMEAIGLMMAGVQRDDPLQVARSDAGGSA